MKAIYPGSFDPITYGHVDIISRARQIFDELVIVIMVNDEKSGSFTMDERLEMVRECIKDYDNVSVVVGNGLTVDFARRIGAKVLVRGIRAVSDYEYELQLATANMTLAEDIHTIFILAKPEYSFLSSSTAKV
ncbi:MAG: pantetheine-phosphate adenylyltransferase, partial [Erysipelotrichaceae bacterium]|nr:pantetheine-phosphate adenylyltransferase [Erysipelotrichaceae bacterium]